MFTGNKTKISLFLACCHVQNLSYEIHSLHLFPDRLRLSVARSKQNRNFSIDVRSIEIKSPLISFSLNHFPLFLVVVVAFTFEIDMVHAVCGLGDEHCNSLRAGS